MDKPDRSSATIASKIGGRSGIGREAGGDAGESQMYLPKTKIVLSFVFVSHFGDGALLQNLPIRPTECQRARRSTAAGATRLEALPLGPG